MTPFQAICPEGANLFYIVNIRAAFDHIERSILLPNLSVTVLTGFPRSPGSKIGYAGSP